MADKPVVMVNFKTYEQSVGKNGLRLAKAIEAEAKKFKGVETVVCPTNIDVNAVSKAVKIPVYGQHVDQVLFGAHTGSVLIENLKETGAKGTLINHSEKQVEDRKALKYLVQKARALRMTTVICAANLREAKSMAALKPDYVAVEPPQLIGTGISVSTSKPEIVSGTVMAVKSISPKTKVLCGAGISSMGDVKAALQLGADGVLLASFVAKAENPRKAIREILKGAVK